MHEICVLFGKRIVWYVALTVRRLQHKVVLIRVDHYQVKNYVTLVKIQLQQ